ncbi:unnamed protein product [Cladocopium goreaui]|uniref:non-specific serine/threonine protein kinase n=1 Tax=Cladocopium goreaui TaxID=2562237 RepID=A0A9P1G947_9DINO|nr:unnamed protein product [Cladocopium goreaui]
MASEWSAVCACNVLSSNSTRALSSTADALKRLAHVGRCWDLARKIPPELYAAAHVLFQEYQAEAAEGKEPSISQCVPGSFTAMLVLLLLWEAHDAPEELFDTALDIIIPLEHSVVAPAMAALGSAGVLDCQTFGRIQDGWWPGVLDLRYLRRLTSRLSRKRETWRLLAETGQEPWHPREVAEQAQLAEVEARSSLCLCILHAEGAETLRATLESYKDGGLLQLAQRRFVVFLKRAEEVVHCWREEVAKFYNLEPIVPVADWPDPFIRKRQGEVNPGAAMKACATSCDQEYLLFLEDDFQLVTRRVPGGRISGLSDLSDFGVPSIDEIRDAYDLEKLLGRGSVGMVYKARRRADGRKVVVKLRSVIDKEVARCCRQEFEVLRRLSHPNIITAIDFLEQQNEAALVFEYCCDMTLQSMVRAW